MDETALLFIKFLVGSIKIACVQTSPSLRKNLESRGPRGGATPTHYLYGYVPPKGAVILKLLVYNGVSISDAVSRTGYNISNARKLSTFVSSHLKAFKDRLLLKYGSVR